MVLFISGPTDFFDESHLCWQTRVIERPSCREEHMKETVQARERTPVLGVVVLMALALGYPQESVADSMTFTGIVIGLEDGDTLRVLRNKARFTMNVAAVDASELDQPYGREAKRAAAALVKNRVVTIRVFGAARQGQVIGEVWLKDKRNLARELVKGGMAWVKRGVIVESDLNVIEADARASRRGLWADQNPVPPWEWRQGQRSRGVSATP